MTVECGQKKHRLPFVISSQCGDVELVLSFVLSLTALIDCKISFKLTAYVQNGVFSKVSNEIQETTKLKENETTVYYTI